MCFTSPSSRAVRNGWRDFAPILEEGSDGVRLMTVHKAKGLEFPVVILADMTAKLRKWAKAVAVESSMKLPQVKIVEVPRDPDRPSAFDSAHSCTQFSEPCRSMETLMSSAA